MSEELEVLLSVCRQLGEADFKYMLTGSMAANYYTIPRMTRDIDIVLDLPQARLDDFEGLFRQEYYIDRNMISSELSRNGMFNLIHNKYIVKIDFIFLKDTDFSQAAFGRRQSVQIAEVPVSIITAEDLAVSKMLWAKDSLSDIQVRDVANIITADPDIDMEYITRWVLKLELDDVFAKVNRQ